MGKLIFTGRNPCFSGMSFRRSEIKREYTLPFTVAILVLVECPFGVWRWTNPSSNSGSRNPCFSGMSFRSWRTQGYQTWGNSRNPCFSGMSFRRRTQGYQTWGNSVAILVLVECPFGVDNSPFGSAVPCRNPCFSGMSFRRLNNLLLKEEELMSQSLF